VPDELRRVLHAVVDRGGWVLGFCSGAFALAHAGLLDGRRATTHWYHAGRFAALFPDIDLDPDVLYVADGPVMTSAGTSAAVDLSLQVLRMIDGPEIANAVARRMVVPPHRDGGQAQFIEHPLPDDPSRPAAAGDDRPRRRADRGAVRVRIRRDPPAPLHRPGRYATASLPPDVPAQRVGRFSGAAGWS
jgi:hypothetical protein